MGASQCSLEPRNEILDRYARLPKNGAKRPAVQFFVVWYYELSKRRLPAKDNMAAVLAFELEAEFAQRLDGITP